MNTLTQPQLEALVDLFVLAVLSDNALTSRESESFETALETLPWHSGIGKSAFLNSAFARIRALKQDGKSAHLLSCASLFDNATDRQAAFDSVKSLLESDGLAKLEEGFERGLQQALKLP